MARRHTRIDRQIVVPKNAKAPPSGLIVTFTDSFGNTSRTFDFRKLSFPKDVTSLFAEAFRGYCADKSWPTNKIIWNAIYTFSRFVAESRLLDSIRDLNTACFYTYVHWLNAQTHSRTGEPLANETRRSSFVAIAILMRWTKRHRTHLLYSNIDIPRGIFSQKSTPREKIPTTGLKAIVGACQREIELTWDIFKIGKEIIHSDVTPCGVDPEIATSIRAIAESNEGICPTAWRKGIGIPVTTWNKMRGYHGIAPYFHLTCRSAIPFFVLICLQLAGNPDAIRRLTRNCCVPDVLDENNVLITWNKPRAGRIRKRAQAESFDTRPPHSVPQLITKVSEMTEIFQAKTRPFERSRLFLMQNAVTSSIVCLSTYYNTHRMVQQFIERVNHDITVWNRQNPMRRRAPIPIFQMAQLRGSVGREHYVASRHDIIAVQRKLNHANLATTARYLQDTETRKQNEQVILDNQHRMHEWILGSGGQDRTSKTNGRAFVRNAVAPIGSFTCRDLLSGIGPRARKNQRCPDFNRCFRCPHLVIPHDAKHLAKVLAVKRALERARSRMDPRRWNVVYSTDYDILVHRILPEFPGKLHESAENTLRDLVPIPRIT